MHITCVCQFCSHHARDDDIAIEIDFMAGCIVWVCPKCNKENKVALNPPPPPALPKIRRL